MGPKLLLVVVPSIVFGSLNGRNSAVSLTCERVLARFDKAAVMGDAAVVSVMDGGGGDPYGRPRPLGIESILNLPYFW